MFIAQPTHGFGLIICDELRSEMAGRLRWRTVEIAVAWANLGGLNRVFNSLRDFLSEGGRVRITVGLDFGRTTFEGLERLLGLEQGADMSTYVFFDENPACTFHPKVFLFSNDEEAYLLVGSTNMTGAGLETNVEAGLTFAGDLSDETILGARDALASWRDVDRDTRIRSLTPELLMQLRDHRYVLTEEEIRTRRAADDGLRASMASPLFGRSSIRPLRPGRNIRGRAAGVGRTTGSALGEVLLMRVRPRRNGNQVQISMKILEASFMSGVDEVVSVDGSTRHIGYNMARGFRNTARFEAPEMRGMNNPVARFQWVNSRHPERESTRVLQYEIFDGDSDARGRAILAKLASGISTPPLTNLEDLSQEETVLSVANPVNAQWYRLDSA
jgi:hypothetical protein